MKSFPTQLASGLNSFCCSTITFHPWRFRFMFFVLHEKLETKLRHKLSEDAKYFPLKSFTIKIVYCYKNNNTDVAAFNEIFVPHVWSQSFLITLGWAA